MTPARTNKSSMRGLTLIELMIALAITGLIGVGIASMMTMVATGTRGDIDGRSSVLQTHAAGLRLRAYLDDALCVLQHDPDRGVVIWLHDVGADGRVNPSEIRVLWWNADAGSIVAERVHYPEGWTALLRQKIDEPVLASSDFFSLMESNRSQNRTIEQTMIEDLVDFTANFNTPDVADATSFNVLLTQLIGAGNTSEAMITFGFGSHRRPTR